MKKETNVKAYTRRTKSGKIVHVSASKRSYDASDKKDAISKKDSGKELSSKKRKYLTYDDVLPGVELSMSAKELSGIKDFPEMQEVMLKKYPEVFSDKLQKSILLKNKNVSKVFAMGGWIPVKPLKGHKAVVFVHENANKVVEFRKNGFAHDTLGTIKNGKVKTDHFHDELKDFYIDSTFGEGASKATMRRQKHYNPSSAKDRGRLGYRAYFDLAPLFKVQRSKTLAGVAKAMKRIDWRVEDD